VFARSRLCGGLALCTGAVIVTLGRVELGVVCEAAVPLRPHNSEVDRIATAEGATRLDDILITRSPKSGHIQLAVPFGIMLRRSRTHLPRSADGIFGPRNLVSAGKASMSLSDPSTSLSPKRKRSITGIVRCISRISACVRFEFFHVGPAGRYITLQNRMSLCPADGLTKS